MNSLQNITCCHSYHLCADDFQIFMWSRLSPPRDSNGISNSTCPKPNLFSSLILFLQYSQLTWENLLPPHPSNHSSNLQFILNSSSLSLTFHIPLATHWVLPIHPWHLPNRPLHFIPITSIALVRVPIYLAGLLIRHLATLRPSLPTPLKILLTRLADLLIDFKRKWKSGMLHEFY